MHTPDQLFIYNSPPTPGLAGRFLEPPFSVLDRRQGRWQDRRRQWDAIGLHSETGRSAELVHDYSSTMRVTSRSSDAGTSIFDPALAELIIAWWSREGDQILDPFAGGSVRGVVSSCMGRRYTGVDLSADQVAADRAQTDLGSPDMPPQWICGDSADIDALLDDAIEADLIMTCPPYGDLERYSDDPADLSTMDWEDFQVAYRTILSATVGRLRQDRFVAVVVSDIKDRDGAYRGLPALTSDALTSTGCRIVADAVILDPLGSKQMMCERPFRANRTLTRVHQNLIVGVKGDRHAATARLDAAQHDPIAS